MNNNFIISLHKDKQSVCIILCNSSIILDCHTIYNTIFETIQEDETYKDITLQDVCDYTIQVFLDSILLQGSSEIESNPLFFGELDKEGVFVESKPVYHLIGETDYDTKDSKETFTQTLQIFLNGNTLTLLNYSLLDSSLNIKLECNSSESKAIQEKEKAQRDKDSSPLAQNDKSQSTSMLHPILEDNEIKCPHNGVVKLKSNKGKSFTSKGIPMVLESDLLNAPIIGCTNNIAGIPIGILLDKECIIKICE